MQSIIIGLAIANMVVVVAVGTTVAAQVKRLDEKLQGMENRASKDMVDIKVKTTFTADSIDGLRETMKEDLHKEVTKLAFTPIMFK